MEIWKSVPGFDGIYEISNHGRLKTLDRTVINGKYKRFWPGKIISLYKGPNGYYNVRLKYAGKGVSRMIHRLVADVFIEGIKPGGQVNHKDGNKLNNHVDNLEWVSQSENMRHTFANGHHSGQGLTHYKARPIKNKATGDVYENLRHAAAENGIHWMALHRMLNGKRVNNTDLSYL